MKDNNLGNELDLSVIIPLTDHRGYGIECVSSFTRGQTHPASQFEVIIISEGNEPELDSQIKNLLRKEDTFLYHQPCHEFELYDYGVRQARGKLLLIIEPHCLGKENCLEEIVKFFDRSDYDAGACQTISINENAVAEMEDRLFKANFDVSSEEKYWNKVYSRAFVIYRSIYLKEGGFEYEYGCFAERAFGAKLYGKGYKLGYAPDAILYHCNDFILKDLEIPLMDYARGECDYRRQHSDLYCDRYFGYSEEWSNRWTYSQTRARSLFLILWHSLGAQIKSGNFNSIVDVQIKNLWRYGLLALLGSRWPLAKSWLRMKVAYLKCWFWRFNADRLYPYYNQYFSAITPYGRYQFITQQDLELSISKANIDRYDLSQMETQRLFGFYTVEQTPNHSFRWSKSIAVICLSLTPDTYKVRVKILPVRPIDSSTCLQIYFENNLIRNLVCENNELLSFELNKEMFSHQKDYYNLVFLCKPLKPWQSGVEDYRELGLPIVEVELSPINPRDRELTSNSTATY